MGKTLLFLTHFPCCPLYFEAFIKKNWAIGTLDKNSTHIKTVESIGTFHWFPNMIFYAKNNNGSYKIYHSAPTPYVRCFQVAKREDNYFG